MALGDIWLYPAATNPADIILRDQTAVASSGGDVNVNVTGVFGAGAVGNVTVTGAANVSPTGVSATASVGSVTVSGAANTSPTGVSATGAVGNVTVTGAANTSPTGVAGTGAVGTASVTGDANTSPTGISGSGFVGTVTVSITSVSVPDIPGPGLGYGSGFGGRTRIKYGLVLPLGVSGAARTGRVGAKATRSAAVRVAVDPVLARVGKVGVNAGVAPRDARRDEEEAVVAALLLSVFGDRGGALVAGGSRGILPRSGALPRNQNMALQTAQGPAGQRNNRRKHR